MFSNKIRNAAFLLLIVSFTIGCGGNGNEQDPVNPNDNKTFSLNIENGTSLSYQVKLNDMVSYTLDITFRELSPKLSYDFVMTNMDYTKGSVEITETARKGSKIINSEFQAGKEILSDKSKMVLSLEAYRDLLETGKTKLFWDGKEQDFQVLKNEDYKFEKGNGSVVEKVLHCNNADNTEQFWVWKNPELPIIMKVDGVKKMELTYWYLPGERP